MLLLEFLFARTTKDASMLPMIVVAIASTGAVYAGHQDCGHGHAACAYGYGVTQRACMSCGYGPGCSPTRPFNYRLAIDYPWTMPSYAQAKAITIGRGFAPACAADNQPVDEHLIEENGFDTARATDETPPLADPPTSARKKSSRRTTQR
jgi:hypothetical protein